ncbi:MAG: radical SAM protein [Candidatus Krumholzibacteria bacterium]|nr:radical SAM protein [Candidatus Krumholzibacteria bacterium]
MLVDAYGRGIDYLRVSVTDRCNLRCVYCMPEEGVALRRHSELLSYEQIAAVVRAGAGLGLRRVRLTGGEPLARRGIEDLVALLRPIPGLREITMTTNGVLLTPQMARKLREAGLDRVNISLDTLDPRRYAQLTRVGDIAAALAGIEAAIGAGFERIKINMVVFEDTTPREREEMDEFCRRRGLVLQTIRHFTLARREHESMHPPVCDRPLPCDRCDRLRLTADGFLKPCLHSDIEIPVDFSDIEAGFIAAVRAKPREGTSCSGRTMREIGG